MNFTKKKIKPEIIWIIDIWTYKSRTAITKYHNKELELIWYWEKRQDFLNNYKENLSWIIKNIEDSIVKAEKNWNIKIKNIVLNIPFEEVFFEVTKINYIRKDTSKKIDDEESKKELGSDIIFGDFGDADVTGEIIEKTNRLHYNLKLVYM